MSQRLDISGSFTCDDGLPVPQWDLLQNWVDACVGQEDQFQAWTDIARQWIETLGEALGENYRPVESDHFLLLAPQPETPLDVLLRFAEGARRVLLSAIPGLAEFRAPGKQVVVAIKGHDLYRRYTYVYGATGEGGSAGMHLRVGYPHVVLCSTDYNVLENTLAHELTHASVGHLALPLWIEEGMAQMFEHDATGRGLLIVDPRMAKEHKRYWRKHGLEIFWRGEGFHRADLAQRLSYELAEVLFRLLCEDHRPRWLGLDRRAQRRLVAFFQNAQADDCGEASANERLGFGLGKLAGQFLGPGDWTPAL